VSLGDNLVFEEISSKTSPDIKFVDINDDSIGCDGGIGCGSMGTDGKGSGVTVWEEMWVGPYEIAVVSAENSNDLIEWLNDNGYVFPVGGEDAVDFYIDKGWYFLAIKVSPGASHIGYYGYYNLPPVEIVFPTDKPVYPMVLTSLSSAGYTLVTLYLVSSGRMEPENFDWQEFEVKDPEKVGYRWRYKDFLYQHEDNAFILEYAGTIDGSFVTRYSINIHKLKMTDDFFFIPAENDDAFSYRKTFYIKESAAPGSGPNNPDRRGDALLPLLVFLVCILVMKVRTRVASSELRVAGCPESGIWNPQPATRNSKLFCAHS
jgi:hypothetical protein